MTTSGRTFYRRPLPESGIAFSSVQGLELFREALGAGTLGCYFRLSEMFQTQEEPAYCGLASLAMVLNALSIDPGRVWKGVWRHYSESMLECCEPLEVVKKTGVTLEKLACTARCNSLDVETLYGVDADTLRAIASRVSRQSPDNPTEFVVASYTRKIFGQTGGGHFSPIAAYHEESDRVLIMDVARFKYPPQWLKVEELAEATRVVDKDSGKPRGLLILRNDSKRIAMPSLRLEFLDHAQYLKDGRVPCFPLKTAVFLAINASPPTSHDDEQNLVRWAAKTVDFIVGTGALPRVKVEDMAYCCSTKDVVQAVATLKDHAKRAFQGGDASFSTSSLFSSIEPEEALMTLIVLPDTFWTDPHLLGGCESGAQAAVPAALSRLDLISPGLADDINDQRRKMSAFLDFTLEENNE